MSAPAPCSVVEALDLLADISAVIDAILYGGHLDDNPSDLTPAQAKRLLWMASDQIDRALDRQEKAGALK